MNTDISALLLACVNGDLHRVKYLIRKGVDIHIFDDAALRYAGIEGWLPVVKYILTLQPNMYWLTHQDQYVRRIYKEYIRIRER